MITRLIKGSSNYELSEDVGRKDRMTRLPQPDASAVGRRDWGKFIWQLMVSGRSLSDGFPHQCAITHSLHPIIEIQTADAVICLFFNI